MAKRNWQIPQNPLSQKGAGRYSPFSKGGLRGISLSRLPQLFMSVKTVYYNDYEEGSVAVLTIHLGCVTLNGHLKDCLLCNYYSRSCVCVKKLNMKKVLSFKRK